MPSMLRFSANINTFNAGADRYVLSGYGKRLNTNRVILAWPEAPFSIPQINRDVIAENVGRREIGIPIVVEVTYRDARDECPGRQVQLRPKIGFRAAEEGRIKKARRRCRLALRHHGHVRHDRTSRRHHGQAVGRCCQNGAAHRAEPDQIPGQARAEVCPADGDDTAHGTLGGC